MTNTTLLSLVFSLLISSAYLVINDKDQEVRDLGNFSEISVATGIKLLLIPGSSNEADIEVENVDLEDIITEIDGDRLKIKVKSKNWGLNWKKSPNRKVNIRLKYKELNHVSASSGASVSSDQTLKNNDLEFDASSGASINLDIEGDAVEADASSGSTIKLSGECNIFDVSVSSGSTIRSTDLEANSVEASASSGAGVKVWAKDNLYAKASSGGRVKYKGNPEEIKKKKSSGGSVRPI